MATMGKGNGHDQSAVRSWHCHLNRFFLLNQIYLTTMCHSIVPLRFILSIWSGN